MACVMDDSTQRELAIEFGHDFVDFCRFPVNKRSSKNFTHWKVILRGLDVEKLRNEGYAVYSDV